MMRIGAADDGEKGGEGSFVMIQQETLKVLCKAPLELSRVVG